MLPVNERPEFTEGYEGFYHLVDSMEMWKNWNILYNKDHDMQKLIKEGNLGKDSWILNYKYGNILP